MKASLLTCLALVGALIPRCEAASAAPSGNSATLRVALRPPPPDNFVIQGKVTAVDRKPLIFTVGHQRVQVTPDTRILIRKGFGSFKDITIGRRVRVEGDGSRAKDV